MKKYLLLPFLCLSLSVSAQTGGALVGEATEIVDEHGIDVRYRYVYGYNKDKKRASETIYRSTKSGTSWSSEVLCTIGTYSYEYDSHDRLSAKSITYTDNDHFTSYRITVSYDDDNYATYRRYDVDGDGLTQTEAWTCSPEGKLTSRTHYGHSDDITRGYGSLGQLIGTWRERHYGDETESSFRYTYGALNDSTVVEGSRRTDGEYHSENTTYSHYAYDATHGRLKEHKNWGEHSYADKREWEYDGLGRVTAIRYYNNDGSEKGSISDTAEEPEWVLQEETTYTYNSNEVYGVGNSWHDVFNFEGPVKTYRMWEHGEDGGTDLECLITFNYDAVGKLIGYDYEQPGWSRDWPVLTTTLAIDNDGHITMWETEDKFLEEDDNVSDWDYSLKRREFVWRDGKIVEQLTKNTEKMGQTYYEERLTTYEYGDNRVIVTEHPYTTQYGSESSGSTTYVEQKNGRYYRTYTNNPGANYAETNTLLIEKQKENVIFTHPNIFKDGSFTPDSIIVASIKDRVVGYWKGGYTSSNRFCDEEDGHELYSNVDDDTYFSVSHEGEETICSNIDGLPVYVLKNGRLVKEFVYWDAAVPGTGGNEGNEGNGSETRAPRRVQSPDGDDLCYDEIEYFYNSKGLLTGQSLMEVKDGVRSESYNVEYVYDESTGITSPMITAKAGLSLSGRHLRLRNGGTFSVYVSNGTAIAIGVTAHTFTVPGIYIINADGVKVKIVVK